MIKESFVLLKRNPLLPLLYLAYILINVLAMVFLMPHNISRNNDVIEMLITLASIMLFALVAGIAGLVFIAGYGNMLTEAIIQEKTNLRSFPQGIARYFVKVLLTALFILAIYVGFSIVLSIAMVPISIMMAMSQNRPTAIINTTVTATLGIIVTVAVPFLVCWIPALFMEKAGVVDCMKAGFKAGVKNYGILLMWTAILYVPSFAYAIINMQSITNGNIYTPGYYAISGAVSLISVLYLPAIFNIYFRTAKAIKA